MNPLTDEEFESIKGFLSKDVNAGDDYVMLLYRTTGGWNIATFEILDYTKGYLLLWQIFLERGFDKYRLKNVPCELLPPSTLRITNRNVYVITDESSKEIAKSINLQVKEDKND